MSDLVGNPEDWFSHNEAHLIFDLSRTVFFLSSKHSVNSQIADQTVACNRNNNKKFRSFKSKENIHKKEVGSYRGFSY